jgi:hypothetical protein
MTSSLTSFHLWLDPLSTIPTTGSLLYLVLVLLVDNYQPLVATSLFYNYHLFSFYRACHRSFHVIVPSFDPS